MGGGLRYHGDGRRVYDILGIGGESETSLRRQESVGYPGDGRRARDILGMGGESQISWGREEKVRYHGDGRRGSDILGTSKVRKKSWGARNAACRAEVTARPQTDLDTPTGSRSSAAHTRSGSVLYDMGHHHVTLRNGALLSVMSSCKPRSIQCLQDEWLTNLFNKLLDTM
ncbi:hypothetical protein BaRGS_00000214 [Batillaria attramentaria]|uniref:Uncharacterized protein n=1 Tax=Batillaria attramentaria TaxID=370345 RepID=A0ABD0MBH0_9CAEN